METCRLLERQVRRFGSLQNAIDLIGRAIVNFIGVGAIRRQTALLGHLPKEAILDEPFKIPDAVIAAWAAERDDE